MQTHSRTCLDHFLTGLRWPTCSYVTYMAEAAIASLFMYSSPLPCSVFAPLWRLDESDSQQTLQRSSPTNIESLCCRTQLKIRSKRDILNVTAHLTWKTRRSGRCPKYFSLSLYYGHSWQSNIMHHHSDRQSAPFLAATAKFSAKMARWEPYLGARARVQNFPPKSRDNLPNVRCIYWAMATLPPKPKHFLRP